MSETINLLPNGDASPNAWQQWGSFPYHYQNVLVQANHLQAGKNNGNAEEKFTMQQRPFIKSVSAIRIYFYGAYTSYECLLPWKPKGRIYFNGAWTSVKYFNIQCNINSWKYIEWTGLDGDQDDLNDLQISIIAPSGMGLLDYVRMLQIYVQATVEFYDFTPIELNLITRTIELNNELTTIILDNLEKTIVLDNKTETIVLDNIEETIILDSSSETIVINNIE